MAQVINKKRKNVDNVLVKLSGTPDERPQKRLNPKRITTEYRGISYREHPSRKYKGHYDRYYLIRYQSGGRIIEEACGWKSGGWTIDKVIKTLGELKVNNSTGQGFKTLKEQREAADEKKRAADERKEREALESQTFDDFWKLVYFPTVARDRRSAVTVRREKALYQRYIRPIIGSKTFKDISIIDLQRIKSTMGSKHNPAHKPAAPRSIQYALNVVRQVFNSARAHKVFTGESPVRGVKPPIINNRRMRFLSKDEAEKLLNALKEHSMITYEISLLSLYTGMRAGEIFALMKSDLDLDNDRIFIRNPKNNVSRYADITTRRLKEMLASKKAGDPKDPVFESREAHRDATGTREPKHIGKISNLFPRVVDALGLNNGHTDRRDKVVFHSLRHTHASWLSNEGIPINLIAEALGQKTLSMAARYAHTSDETRRQKTRIFEEMDSHVEAQPASNIISLDDHRATGEVFSG